MKTWYPEAWKPLGIKPVEETITEPAVREYHSFLGTKTVDINTGNIVTSFYEHFMGGVRKPYPTSHEDEMAKEPFDNYAEERRVAGGRIVGIEAEDKSL